MPKGKFLLLVFLFAAAVVLGCTIGLISNVSYIVHETDMIRNEESDSSTENEKSTVNQKPVIPAPTGSQKSQTDAGNTSNVSQAAKTAASSSSAFMVVSEDEKSQIKDMLFSIGMTEKDNLDDFIRQFQSKNSLNPTGYLDSQTLNAIIRQSTLQQVSKSLQRRINS
ncbi:MAG: peptidoglycan-binding domain-containing protein [Syntrophomonas sp.]